VSQAAAGSTVLVVGLGNPLMADDGFGEAVVDALRRRGLPRGVSAETAPDVFGLWSLWQGEARVWLVDAVALDEPPGTVHLFDHDEIFELSSGAGSAHHLSLVSSLQWLMHAHPGLRSVRYRLWGAEPATVSARPRLSESVTVAVAAVATEIQNLAASRTVDVAGGPHRVVS